jgi:uncharacterized integral membrane protein
MEKSMKKATLLLWVIIFGFIALFIFQNQDFFLAKKAFNLNLGVKQYQIPELNNAILVLVFFCTGLIIAYLFSFSARFKAKRTIKRLNLTIASHINGMAELKSEINTLKGIEEPVDEQGKTTKLDLNASRKIAAKTAAGSTPEKTVNFGADDTSSNPGDDTDTGETLIREKD